jgi:hypothetical protein
MTLESPTSPRPSPPPRAERERAVPMRPELAHRLRRAMDALYWACAGIAGSAMVIISLVVPWGVYTRMCSTALGRGRSRWRSSSVLC